MGVTDWGHSPRTYRVYKCLWRLFVAVVVAVVVVIFIFLVYGKFKI